jgi:hypothetical protein
MEYTADITQEGIQMTISYKCLLSQGFKNLRNRGYGGDMNGECCPTCGRARMKDNGSDRYAFYVDQCEPLERGETCLQWSGDPFVVIDAMKDAGLRVYWTELDGSCILVEDPAKPETSHGPHLGTTWKRQ